MFARAIQGPARGACRAVGAGRLRFVRWSRRSGPPRARQGATLRFRTSPPCGGCRRGGSAGHGSGGRGGGRGSGCRGSGGHAGGGHASVRGAARSASPEEAGRGGRPHASSCSSPERGGHSPSPWRAFLPSFGRGGRLCRARLLRRRLHRRGRLALGRRISLRGGERRAVKCAADRKSHHQLLYCLVVHCRVPFVIRASPFSRLHWVRTTRRRFLTKFILPRKRLICTG